MKILYYNWVDYLDRERRGGGVSVYQRNLLDALHAHGGNEAHFLSSGIAHELRRRAPRWAELPPARGEAPVRRFEIVNAGLLAPAHADYASPAQLDHAETEAVFRDFVARNGPYDVIHFNNLEGLPAAVLRIRRHLPDTRLVLTLHNYYPFCPQVNLWHNEARNCTEFAEGQRCAACLPVRPDPRSVRLAHAVSWRMNRLGIGPGTPAFDHVLRPLLGAVWRGYRALKLLRRPLPVPAGLPDLNAGAAFARRRVAMVALINAHVDTVLCVSDRVRQIAAHYGIAC